MTGIIEVRIRKDYQDNSKHLTTWPIGDLDNLLSLLGRWTVIDQNGDGPWETTDLSGQFVHTPRETYFEIVMHTEE